MITISKSQAKKYREHSKRNGKRDATLNRGTAPEISTHVRTTKTKRAKLESAYEKEKQLLQGYK